MIIPKRSSSSSIAILTPDIAKANTPIYSNIDFILKNPKKEAYYTYHSKYNTPLYINLKDSHNYDCFFGAMLSRVSSKLDPFA